MMYAIAREGSNGRINLLSAVYKDLIIAKHKANCMNKRPNNSLHHFVVGLSFQDGLKEA